MRHIRILSILIAVIAGPALSQEAAPAKPKAKAPASTFHVLDVDKVALRYQKFDDNRDPYVPQWDERWAYRAGLEWNLTMLEWGYWRNDVHTEALETGVVKTVGWQWELGIRLPFMRSEIFQQHHSRHIMDERPRERDGDVLPGRGTKFPVEQSYGIRVTLYERKDR